MPDNVGRREEFQAFHTFFKEFFKAAQAGRFFPSSLGRATAARKAGEGAERR
jgi:hypothetical protein